VERSSVGVRGVGEHGQTPGTGDGVPGDDLRRTAPGAGGHGTGLQPAGRGQLEPEPQQEPSAATSAGRFRPDSQADLAPSGQKARFRANLEAIRIVRELEAQERPATEAEQRALAQWSSWGAVPQLFDKDDWANERAQLRQVLSEREYAAASRTTTNARTRCAELNEKLKASIEPPKPATAAEAPTSDAEVDPALARLRKLSGADVLRVVYISARLVRNLGQHRQGVARRA
jgi:hypothetical protein